MQRGRQVSLSGLRARDFHRALATARGPVIVMFGSPSCRGCRKLFSSLRRLSQRLSDRIDVHLVDARREMGLAQRLGISVLPTVVLFQGRMEVARYTGYRSRAALEAQMMPLLALLEDRCTVPEGPSVDVDDVMAIRRILDDEAGSVEKLLAKIVGREGRR